jgi:hypothetical protein
VQVGQLSLTLFDDDELRKLSVCYPEADPVEDQPDRPSQDAEPLGDPAIPKPMGTRRRQAGDRPDNCLSFHDRCQRQRLGVKAISRQVKTAKSQYRSDDTLA